MPVYLCIILTIFIHIDDITNQRPHSKTLWLQQLKNEKTRRDRLTKQQKNSRTVQKTQPVGTLNNKTVQKTQPVGTLNNKTVQKTQPVGTLNNKIVQKTQPLGTLNNKTVENTASRDFNNKTTTIKTSVAEPKLFIFGSVSFLAPPLSLISAPAPAPALYCYLKKWEIFVFQLHKNYTTKAIS